MAEDNRINLECQSCGAPIDRSLKCCPYCDTPYSFCENDSKKEAVFEEFSDAQNAPNILTAPDIMAAFNKYQSKKRAAKALFIISIIATILTSGILTPLLVIALINHLAHSQSVVKMENIKPYVLGRYGMPRLNIFLLFILLFTFIGAFLYLALFIQKYNSWKNDHQALLDEVSSISELTYVQAVALYMKKTPQSQKYEYRQTSVKRIIKR